MAFEPTVKLYFPFISLVIPFVVPFSTIDTPGTVAPLASVTVPLTFVCANTLTNEAKSKTIMRYNLLPFIIINLLVNNFVLIKINDKDVLIILLLMLQEFDFLFFP